MVVSNLKTEGYQSKEAQLFFLKDKADRVSNFISGLRKSKGKVYLQIMAEVTGVESLVTLQSFLLQVSLYFRKFSDSRLNDTLEIWRAHEALALYYREKDFSGIVNYLKEVKVLFKLIDSSRG
jgi:hypothetical protein